MQKGDKNKLKLFLVGVKARLDKNKDYFINVIFTFKSGKKEFIGEYQRNGDKYILDFNGISKEYSFDQICIFFEEEAEKYENSTLKYCERGSVIEIIASAKGVNMKQYEENTEDSNEKQNTLISCREYTIKIDKARELLSAIGILTKDGKMKNDMIRKYNQIDYYVKLVGPMFEKEEDEIVLLDCACGKSYLSFVMNYYLRDILKKRCRIIGIDINEHVVNESKKLAQSLRYNNMEFITADLRKYQPSHKVTGVISLHACDIATDLALATAIRAKAKYIACVPCCHKELLEQINLGQLQPLSKHGVFKARFNDVITDSLRALKLEAEGYKVSVVEYISPLDTPKNILIKAQRKSKGSNKAKNEYNSVIKYLGTFSELDRCTSNIVCGEEFEA